MAILLWEKGLIILPWGMGVSYIVLEDRFEYIVLVNGGSLYCPGRGWVSYIAPKRSMDMISLCIFFFKRVSIA